MTSKPSTPAPPKTTAPKSSSKTATSTPRLSEYARHFSYPDTIARTVWPRVEAKGIELGLGFDWWQSQAGTVILGYGIDGKYVATVGGVGMSIPRQVGKTYFVLAMLVILCILFPGLQVVWTAHHLRTSTKTFTTLRGMARRKKIAPHIRSIRTANGEQEVAFANGSKIMFGARSQGFGRGFDEIDVEVFDEAQILDTKALEDMVAATNQARHEHGALLIYMGTPPRPSDPSEAFTLRRAEAIAGESEDAIWLEIGADPESDPNDRSQWARMNPSYPKRTPLESMLRLRKNLKDDDSWNREGRGVWDADAVVEETIFGSPEVWSSARTTQVPDGVAALGLAMTADRSTLALVGASLVEFVPENDPEAEPIDLVLVAPITQSSDFDTVVAEAARIQREHDCSLLLDARGPASTLRDALEAADISVDPAELSSIAAGCASFVDRLTVSPPTLRHLANAELDQAVNAAVWRWVGDLRVIGRRTRKGVVDVAMLEAAVLAVMGAESGSTFNIF